MLKFLSNVANKARNKASAVFTACMLALLTPFAAMAQTTPVDTVKAAITAGQADAIEIAVAVVVALWAIWAIYLMRRKG